MTYRPQLDSLRAIAVIGVMASHFLPRVDRLAPLGGMGVRLFYVLSGFLITSILLSYGDRPLGNALKTFYARRVLRIFPLFYFVLAVAALLDISVVRESLGWHLAYLSNAFIYRQGTWQGAVSHFWSLAVEEQFYLVWPWLVLGLAPARAMWIAGAMAVAAPVTVLLNPHPMASVLPTSCLDSLGLGALLAWPASRPGVMRWGARAGLPVLAASLAGRYLAVGGALADVGVGAGTSLVSAWLVGRAAEGFAGTTGRVLELRPLMYLGTISYGVYVYHAFVPYLMGRLFGAWGTAPSDWPWRFAVLSAVTIALASVSWRVLERPMLRLKARFV